MSSPPPDADTKAIDAKKPTVLFSGGTDWAMVKKMRELMKNRDSADG